MQMLIDRLPRVLLLTLLTAAIVACGGDGDTDSSGSSSDDADSGDSGDGDGDGDGDTGESVDCTDDADVCADGTTCSCFDKTGDGTMVTCSCQPECGGPSDCPSERPNCGCSADDTKVCKTNQMCFGG